MSSEERSPECDRDHAPGGFELQVSQPQVIEREVDGAIHEPFEGHIECEDPFSGTVIEKLNTRGGDLQDLQAQGDGSTRIRYLIPSRGLIGYRSEFLTDTRGTGVMYPMFSHYGPRKGNVRSRPNGVLITQDNCETVAYALSSLQERGVLCTHQAQRFTRANHWNPCQIQ